MVESIKNLSNNQLLILAKRWSIDLAKLNPMKLTNEIIESVIKSINNAKQNAVEKQEAHAIAGKQLSIWIESKENAYKELEIARIQCPEGKGSKLNAAQAKYASIYTSYTGARINDEVTLDAQRRANEFAGKMSQVIV